MDEERLEKSVCSDWPGVRLSVADVDVGLRTSDVSSPFMLQAGDIAYRVVLAVATYIVSAFIHTDCLSRPYNGWSLAQL